jgi:hypothetical protein
MSTNEQATNEVFEHTGQATLILHSVVFGTSRTEVVWIRATWVKPDGHYSPAARVAFKQPRKRLRTFTTINPDNIRYAQIGVAGAVVWDSRAWVPCDQFEAKLKAYRERCAREEAARTQGLPIPPSNDQSHARNSP